MSAGTQAELAAAQANFTELSEAHDTARSELATLETEVEASTGISSTDQLLAKRKEVATLNALLNRAQARLQRAIELDGKSQRTGRDILEV